MVYGAGAAAIYGAGAADAAAAYRPTAAVINQPAQTAQTPAAPPPPAAAPQTTESKLRRLKSMLDSGLITQSQYDAKQKQLLADF